MNKIKAYQFNSLEERAALVTAYGNDFFAYVPVSTYNKKGTLFPADINQKKYAAWSDLVPTNHPEDFEIVPFSHLKETTKNMKRTSMAIGDKIICNDNKESNSLNLNKEYIVVQINSFGNLGLQENFGSKFLLPHFYKPERFTLADEKAAPKAQTIDFSKEYKTRGGKKVNLIGRSKNKNYPIVGDYFDDGEWYNAEWTEDGQFHKNEGGDYDLIEVKKKQTIKGEQFTATVYADQSILIKCTGISSNTASLDKKEMAELVELWQSFN